MTLEDTTVHLARQDLADRLGIDGSEIAVLSQVEMDWPDGSLGCPQPGMRYKQAIVNGTLTVLVVDGIEYRYHAGGGRAPFLCEPRAKDSPTAIF
ncbi:MAG: hypothetical protein ACR2NG_08885 [Acidimicrobiia bacterium]